MKLQEIAQKLNQSSPLEAVTFINRVLIQN
jgi:hypothetical protein